MINWNSTEMDVYIWDVGHGLSVTIITPVVYAASGFPIMRRRVVQIDAGNNGQYHFYPVEHLVKKRGLKTIDCLILSHPDQDHISDLPALDRLMQSGEVEVLTLLRNRTFPISQISQDASQESEAKKIYRKLHNNYNGQAQPHHLLAADNWGGVSFYTTHLDASDGRSSNDASVVVDVKFGKTQIVIPGDLEEAGALELIRLRQMPIPINDYRILVAPHHGSETANPVELLKFYKPHVVLASVEEGHENTDATYSREEYVSGHPITQSNGKLEVSRFNGTKGEAIHINVTPTYPFIKRIPYEKVENPLPLGFLDSLLKTKLPPIE